MPLKCQLINAALGELTVSPDPGGLVDFELEIKRSEENDGLFYEFGLNLDFYQEARNFIRDVYESEGIQGLIQINIYEYKPNQYTYSLVYTGELRLKDYRINETRVSINVEKVGFERQFINLKGSDINLEDSLSFWGESLGSMPFETISLPAREILQETFTTPPEDDAPYEALSNISFDFDTNANGQFRSATRTVFIDNSVRVKDQLVSLQPLGWGFSSFGARPFLIIDKSETGQYTISVSARSKFKIVATLVGTGDADVCGSAHLAPWYVTLKFQVFDKNGNNKADITLGNYSTIPACGNNEAESDFEQFTYAGIFNLVEGDEVYCFYEILVEGSFDISGQPISVVHDLTIFPDSQFTFTDISAITSIPSTTTKTFLAHEVLDRLVSYYTDNQCTFYSEFFGRTDLGYGSDGEGSLLGFTNGWLIRQLEKEMFVNFDEFFACVNSIYCLGWGFEIDGGIQRLRIEPKTYFYNRNLPVATFESVADIEKAANTRLYYTQVEIGYPPIEQIGTINAIDEINTVRRYTAPITQANNKLTLISPYYSSPYQIEGQRRLTDETQESKLDEKIFILALKRVGMAFEVETGSDYTLFGVFSPSTLYNIRLRPSKMMEAWKPVIAGTLVRGDNKTFKFTYGTYNYEASVDGELENRDIVISDMDALWYPDTITFRTKITQDERMDITNSQTGVITIKDYDGRLIRGYILSAKTVLDKNEAEISLLRLNGKIND